MLGKLQRDAFFRGHSRFVCIAGHADEFERHAARQTVEVALYQLDMRVVAATFEHLHVIQQATHVHLGAIGQVAFETAQLNGLVCTVAPGQTSDFIGGQTFQQLAEHLTEVPGRPCDMGRQRHLRTRVPGFQQRPLCVDQ